MKRKSESNNFVISTNKKGLNIFTIHRFLTNSYWTKGIPIEAVKKQIKYSFCFGVYNDKKQIGYARIITDYTGFAYLCDVYIEEEFQGKGLSKRLMEEIINHPKLKNIKTWMLSTNDAHGLYEKYGFKPLDEPRKLMRRVKFKNWGDK